MEKHINNNGYEYVDLGLPSGTLWATCNVGASRSSDYGQYFQWGDTVGRTYEQVGFGDGKKDFSSVGIDYKFGITIGDYIKYTFNGATLDLEDDAAHVNMGGGWHMPTPEQIQELLDNTIESKTSKDGINGITFISKKDNTKRIFFPLAGYATDGGVYFSECSCNVWSNTLSAEGEHFGQYLYYFAGIASIYNYYRYSGFSVRGVIDGKCGDAK